MRCATIEGDPAVIEALRSGNAPVIIFGAGVVGEALHEACLRAGIDVACFCENNVHKTKALKRGIPVCPVAELPTRFHDAEFLISAADIRDVVEQLRQLGYRRWHPSSVLLRSCDLSQFSFEASPEFVEFAVSTCLLCHDNYLQPDKLFLRSVDIIVTERCSLKCRDCSNLMQYYQRPVDCHISQVVSDIDALCATVDGLNEVRLIGGEPLMNRDFGLVVQRLVSEPKVRRIVIYTNGTIVPNSRQLELLRDRKLLFLITDYGLLSKKRDELVRTLRNAQLDYHIVKAGGWSECSAIRRHNRTDLEQVTVFASCCAKNLLTLSEGKLYRCPFAANADRLRAIPDFEEDHVSLLESSYSSESSLALKHRVRAFLMEKRFLEACDYCSGRPFGAPEIPAAVQTRTPLEYERFSR
jgi:organic radical activating enzyme